MNTFIKDTETGEIYYFDLYEKWWYCFFLLFAIFLPHRCRKIEDIDLFYQVKKNNVLKKDPNLGWKSVMGAVFGKFLVDKLPDNQLNWINEKYYLVFFIVCYFLWVFSAYLIDCKYKEKAKVNMKEIFEKLTTVNKKVQYCGISLKNKKMWKAMLICLLFFITIILIIVQVVLTNGAIMLMFLSVTCLLFVGPLISYALVIIGIYRSKDGSKYEHVSLMKIK